MSTANTTAPTLTEMGKRVYDCNVANGWFDEDRTFGDDVALLHSEVSEMFEAFRDHGLEDVTEVLCTQSSTEHDEHLCKPEGFGSEAADVLVRLLDTDYRHGLGFAWETVNEVPKYTNFDATWTVGQHIAHLHMLISYLTEDTSLSPILAYLKTWCDDVEIDLQTEFERKLAYNKTRGYRHGGKRV